MSRTTRRMIHDRFLKASAPAAAMALATMAVALTGCTTARVKDAPSQAILDARGHERRDAAAACPDGPIPSVLVGFGFGEADITDLQQTYLKPALDWLQCHPQTAVVIRPASDGHGSEAEQTELARRRAAVVTAYMKAHGVTAPTTVLARGAAEPAGQHILIQAWGRRW